MRPGAARHRQVQPGFVEPRRRRCAARARLARRRQPGWGQFPSLGSVPTFGHGLMRSAEIFTLVSSSCPNVGTDPGGAQQVGPVAAPRPTGIPAHACDLALRSLDGLITMKTKTARRKFRLLSRARGPGKRKRDGAARAACIIHSPETTGLIWTSRFTTTPAAAVRATRWR